MTDYKFSKQIKMFSIILIIIGAIGIAFGFYSAPSNVEEAKEIVANMSHDDHGGGHSDDAHGDDGHTVMMDTAVGIVMMGMVLLVMSMIMISMFSTNYIINHGLQSMCQLYSL